MNKKKKNSTLEKISRAGTFALSDLSVWFLFFFIIYVILLLKVTTYHSFYNSVFFGFYSFLITTYILSRFLLAYFHKPFAVDMHYEPTVTFVVPAKNEVDNIRETLLKFIEIEYPLNKVEVVAIDDGSDDGTYEEMCAAKRAMQPFVKRIDLVRWDVNRGKRHGMAEGVKRSRHDIIIFIDSDSFIEPDCVRHLVKYFVDPRVGGVSGHTDVYNRNTNTLTQMQGLRYYISFKIYKAAESVFGLVTCLPGCCSAYRREYLMEFLDDWLYQTFLGKECTFGDDRSLTNYMLRKYKACYSAEARANTVVPDNFRTYMRQQQRWKKSWIRETFIASLFMWRKNMLAALSFYTYIFLAFVSPIVFFRAMLWHPFSTGNWPIVYLIGLGLMLLLHGLYYRAKVGKRAWLLAVLSFWVNTVILIWQLPWALITIRDSRWGTR